MELILDYDLRAAHSADLDHSLTNKLINRVYILNGIAYIDKGYEIWKSQLEKYFKRTEFNKASKTNLEDAREEFEAMFNEMKADYNCTHFDRKASLELYR